MKKLKNEQIVFLGDQTFQVQENKANRCTGCDAGDHCKEVYLKYSKGNKMGCHRINFKLIEKK